MLNKLPKKTKNLLLWVLIIISLTLLFSLINNKGYAKKMSFFDFLKSVESGQVVEVVIHGDTIDGIDKDNQKFTTLAPFFPQLISLLYSKNVRFEVLPAESSIASFFNSFLVWFPGVLFVIVYIYFMRSMQKGGGAMSFGKSRAKLIADTKKTTFNDVAGIDEAREELSELVDFLRDPSKFQKLGGRIPRGCLLVGAPGTGKTLLAKAIAGEAGVPFFSISGSDFVEMFVGVGASRVRDMFTQAKKQAPCILFIDEIDAVGRHRGSGKGHSNDEREQTLNQILVEMDGFSDNSGVIVLAATNRPDVLDHALLRPGRFDRQIHVPIPDINGREKILTVHTRNTPLAEDVDLRIIARGTPGFTGADLANLINEAALLAARKNHNMVTLHILELAKDKVLMGPERKSMVITEKEKKLTAYHEAGHALLCLHLPSADPIHKVTIIPRGNALGLVMKLPEDDRVSVTIQKLKTDIAIAMGGRVAEEMIFGKDFITTGASADIQGATEIARKMVAHWGFSKKIGHVRVGVTNSYGYESMSENISATVDSEVKEIIEEGYSTAQRLIKKHVDQLHLIANALLKNEILTGYEVTSIIKDKTILKDGQNLPDIQNTESTEDSKKKKHMDSV